MEGGFTGNYIVPRTEMTLLVMSLCDRYLLVYDKHAMNLSGTLGACSIQRNEFEHKKQLKRLGVTLKLKRECAENSSQLELNS